MESPTLRQARLYVAFGHPCFPGRAGGKEPAHVLDSWLQYVHRMPTEEELVAWFAGELFNIACPMGVTMRVDFDEIEQARAFWRRLGKERFKTITTSPRPGVHFWFRAPRRDLRTVKIKGGELKFTGYCIEPVSEYGGIPYEFVEGHPLVHVEELPLFDENWLDELIPAAPRIRSSARHAVHDALQRINGIHAVSGQRGHDATFHVACILAETPEMTEADAIEAMIEWSRTNAHPEWDVKSIIHKVRDAFSRVR